MRSSPLALRPLCALVTTALLAALLVTAGAPPAARDIAPTAGSTYLCYGYAGCRSEGFSDAGYGAVNDRMYWNMYPGHNCTNYVAYRMIRAGMSTKRPFGYPGNASHWGRHRSDITDNQPRVGAVAWWDAYDNGSGSAGHVAYVERVLNGGRTIVISEDSWGGTFHWRRITKSSGRWPSGFIHFVDRKIENTRRPQIRGTVKLGERVKGTNGQWKPRGGSKRYNWFADGKLLPKQTGQYLKLRPGLVGKRLSHRVTVTKDGWETGRKWSRKTASVEPGDLSVTTQPVVSGTTAVGRTLTVDTGGFSPTPDSVRIRWVADGKRIPGATGRKLTLTKAQAGARIKARVIASKAAYNNKWAASEPTDWVRNGFMTVAESARIKGWPTVGWRLTAKPGIARPNWAVETRYQWLRDGRPIQGETGQRYRLTAADFNRRIGLRVTYSNPNRYGTTETVVKERRVRARPKLTTRTRVKGNDGRKVVVNAILSDPAVNTVTGKVTVGFAGQWKSTRLQDGKARLVFRKVPHGTRRATVRFHNNWKFVRAVQRPWIQVKK